MRINYIHVALVFSSSLWLNIHFHLHQMRNWERISMLHRLPSNAKQNAKYFTWTTPMIRTTYTHCTEKIKV